MLRQTLITFGTTQSVWRSGAALIFLALVGCAETPATSPSADQRQIDLFHEAYSGIAKYYIDPVTPGALAVAGLRNLASIDPTLSVEVEDEMLALRQDTRVMRFAAPAGGDAEGWANLTDEAAAAARSNSATLAALSTDRLDQLLLDGGMKVLDRFSHYAPPQLAQERRAARDGFGGIGVILAPEGAEMRILEVLPETPAAAAGLRAGDQILAIDGVEVDALAREDVVHRLRGPADSLIALALARRGSPERLSVALHRALIVPPSVSSSAEAGIAHFRVTSFNQQTAQRLGELLRQAHRELGPGLRGIILDLRGNPGGLLDQSIEAASLFLDGAPVASTVGRVAESIQYFTAPHRAVETLPLAVLVNGGSASAAEIVASALQDMGRAVVVGTASYGKGTVQNVQRMPNDGELTITWARLIAPGGYVLHQHGVVPTICTSGISDDAEGVAEGLTRSTSTLAAEFGKPRAKLDETAWLRLRELCPGQRQDRAVEVRVAEKILADPALYARALALGPAATRPIATAGMVR
jgi:carboxyl-terminal processing protease